MTLVQELAAAVVALKQARTAADVGKVYEGLVGYDSHVDNPSAPYAELAALAVDYVCELCGEYGIHVSRVGLTPGDVSDFIDGVTE